MKSKSRGRRKFTTLERISVYDKGNGLCAICGEPIDFDNFTVDHIVPLYNGGSNAMDNLQPTCFVCNQMKQNMNRQQFLFKIREIFFNNLFDMVSLRKRGGAA